MLKAAFPGSFDPPTFGHLNVVERARGIFDELHIVVAVNRQKQYLFTPEERIEMMEEFVRPWPNVKVGLCDTLIVDYLRARDLHVLIRGVRGVTDFSYEFDLSMMNKGLDPSIETIFMTTDPRYFVLRSSAIKELASFGGDVSSMVPKRVADALKLKLAKHS
ncbi:pantetheine-phosphate adenylyltransferase [Treponema sp.]